MRMRWSLQNWWVDKREKWIRYLTWNIRKLQLKPEVCIHISSEYLVKQQTSGLWVWLYCCPVFGTSSLWRVSSKHVICLQISFTWRVLANIQHFVRMLLSDLKVTFLTTECFVFYMTDISCDLYLWNCNLFISRTTYKQLIITWTVFTQDEHDTLYEY